MKFKTIVSMAVAGSGLVMAPSARAINILVNPGFETGDLTGWTTNGFVATNNDAHTGKFSAFSRGNVFVQQDFAAVSVPLITEVSVWSKQPNLQTYFFAFDFIYGDASSVEVLSSPDPAGNVWTKFDFTSQLDGSKSLVGIRAWGYSAGSDSDFTFHDDFVVNVVPEPATLAVVGLGLAALARSRRRRR